MVDIHTHLLPEYDDGPQSVDETRKMLEVAEKGGTHTVVVTPHILDFSDYERKDEILQKFELVKKTIRQDGRNIKAFLGGEIFLFPDTQLDQVFSTINNNGKYALVEFGMRQIPEFIPQKLFDFVMAEYKPILAHPERYIPIIKNPKYAYKFANMGVALQMNAGSILGVFGSSVKEVAHELIEHNCIHIIASDGHNTNSRTISLKEAKEYVTKSYGEEKAKILFEVNPMKAIKGEQLIIEEPIPFDPIRKKNSTWDNFKKKFKLDKFLG